MAKRHWHSSRTSLADSIAKRTGRRSAPLGQQTARWSAMIVVAVVMTVVGIRDAVVVLVSPRRIPPLPLVASGHAVAVAAPPVRHVVPLLAAAHHDAFPPVGNVAIARPGDDVLAFPPHVTIVDQDVVARRP